jgi:DNA gyrase subunit A
VAGTHDYLLCFSNYGQVFWLKVYRLPEAGRTAPGRAISNLLPLRDGERITNLLRVPEFDSESFVMFATKHGTVKKTRLEAYSRPKRGGIRAIKLEESDEVVAVCLCRPGDTLLLASDTGKAIRFDESAARAMGRTSVGVRGIRLPEGAQVIGMVVADPEAHLVTACKHGYGKRTPVVDYPVKGRGGQGVISIRTTERNGPVMGINLARDEDDVMFITAGGMIVRSPVADTRPMGRNTQGVRLVNLKAGDELVGTEVVSAHDLEQYGLLEDEPSEPSESAEGSAPVADEEPPVVGGGADGEA